MTSNSIRRLGRKRAPATRGGHGPSPAIIIATVAIVLASTGGALAAGHYLITSTTQIKPSVLKKLQGRPGIAGTPGIAGAPGRFSAANVTDVTGPQGAIPAGTAQTATATCPAGSIAIGGGGFSDATAGLAASQPFLTTGWSIISYSSIQATQNAYAVCASGSAAADESDDTRAASSRRALAAEVIAIEKSHATTGR